MIEINHKRAQLAHARLEQKMASRRLAMIHFSLREKYDDALAREAGALIARIADLKQKLEEA